MSSYCSYKNCQNVQRSFSSKTFFNLPTDDRRQVWIENSGNEKLKNIEPTVRKVFCEDHFDPKYLRKQFQRTILRREAVPYPFCEDDQEIEFIEVCESEEDSEINVETPKVSDETSKVVILLNKNPQIQRNQVKQIKYVTKNIKTANLRATSSKAVPKSIDMRDEVKFSACETAPKTMTEDEYLTETGYSESGPSVVKKSRYEIELTTKEENESIQYDQQESGIQPSNALQMKVKQSISSRTSTEGIVSSSETVDSNNEETYFAMSLVGILKRLNPHKRAIAKCHILSYLTELEYGSSSLS